VESVEDSKPVESSLAAEPGPHPAGLQRYVPDVITRRYSGSFAERFWNRLTSTDFMSKAMILAAVFLLCFFPFAIVFDSFTGQSDFGTMARNLGLNQQAAHDVSTVFAPHHATTSSISGAGYVLFIVGAIAFASAVQDLYEKVFGLEARGFKNFPRQAAVLLLVIGGSFVTKLILPPLYGWLGLAPLYVLGFGVFILSWWVIIRLLIAGRIGWRELFPSALATAFCWTGMLVVFRFVFSNEIIGDYKKYGPVGVVLALMSFFIAIGVVLILGAVFGIVWRERKTQTGDSPPSTS
jgi:membrane protein